MDTSTQGDVKPQLWNINPTALQVKLSLKHPKQFWLLRMPWINDRPKQICLYLYSIIW